jgi:hypothetical protein
LKRQRIGYSRYAKYETIDAKHRQPSPVHPGVGFPYTAVSLAARNFCDHLFCNLITFK